MPDSVTGRSSAAVKRPAAGPPLKTKAEKRAEAKVTKARARERAKRQRILNLAGVVAVVIALLVGMIVWIGNTTGSTASTTDAGATAGATPAAADPTTAAAAFPPLPEGADPALGTKPKTTAGSGTLTALKSATLIEGTGAAVQSGQTVNVNYVGVSFKDGTEFDSSWKNQQPFSFQVGAGKVIKGWDQGLVGAKVGSRIQLDIPSDLAYGDDGDPSGPLRFIVDVLSVS
ncbi:MAG TPA: FKBP-type peptidyl-prolyl cis-trans isomerase [Actinoplanes sp.]|nr:FKBP-type peptidyl-prolyl cis-trans isomerase [Actinoplanes sp.]